MIRSADTLKTSPVRPVPVCGYGYDALNCLVRVHTQMEGRWRFWQGQAVVNELRTRDGVDDVSLTWLRSHRAPVAELADDGAGRLTLLATSVQGAVLTENDTEVRPVAYAPYGSRPPTDSDGAAVAELAFNGEMLDAASGCYLLGAGHHRPYSPTLGLFLASDRFSPFGRGGLNSLSYCAGDPINRTDPTGHFWKWVIAGAAFALGAIATAFTAFTAVGVLVGAVALTKSSAAAVAGTALGVASMGVEVAALTAHELGDETAGSILGWVGLGLGLAGVAGAMPAIVKAAGRAATRITEKMARFSQRVQAVRTQGLSGRGAIEAGRRMAAPGPRRQTMFVPSAAQQSSLPTSTASRSRLLGYHGTSRANADQILRGGSERMFLTDRVESAQHYARAVGGDDGVVLGMYADDVDGWTMATRPKINGKGYAEIDAYGRTMHARIAGADAPPVDDFMSFFGQRAMTHEDILASLRMDMGEDAFNARMQI